VHKSVAFILLLAASLQANATDYYIAANGNDHNNGTSSKSPFKTIAKLNTIVLKPGDKILFKRGDTFRGQLNIKQSGTASKPITITSYGNGALPIISGSEYVNNWSLHKGKIYKAALNVGPEMVFFNNVLHLPARFPNSGFLTIDKANGKKGFYDAELTQAKGYWNGATLHNRMVRWEYGEHKVKSFVDGHIALIGSIDYDFINGWGYFFSNKMEALDAAGEYYFNSSQKNLYLWSVSLPANNSVEASVCDYGINIINASFVDISNIGFRHQQVNGVNADYAYTDISVEQCRFNGIYSKAIFLQSVNNVLIKNNVITDICGAGIYAGYCKHITVQNNAIKRIGLYPGWATKYGGAYTAMWIWGDIEDGNISFNSLDSIGHNGIFFSKNTRIENNLVNNYCLTIDDGGAMYTGTPPGDPIRNGTGCVIRNNIIQNGIGNVQATPEKTGSANGIYMDDASGHALIQNNTVVNCSRAGIFLHNSINNTVSGNTLFNCRGGSILMSQDSISTTPVSNNTIKKNILYSVDENSYPLVLTNWENRNLDFATYAGNYYCSPYNELPISTISQKNKVNRSILYTLSQWKALKDASAKSSHVSWSAYSVIDILSDNLIVNGNFDSNIDGWWCWSPTNTCTSSWGVNNQLNNGSWHLQCYDGVACNMHNYFGLEAGQTYELSFSTIAPAPGTVDVQTRDASTYGNLEMHKTVLVDTKRKDSKIIFMPTYGTDPARIDFDVNTNAPDYWLDNIRLLKVKVLYDDPLKRNLIFINRTNSTKSISLSQTLYDLDDHAVSGSITLPSYTSKILLKK
jgi:parallel beta-helix repeat protein